MNSGKGGKAWATESTRVAASADCPEEVKVLETNKLTVPPLI